MHELCLMTSFLRTACSSARSCFPGTDKKQRALEKQVQKKKRTRVSGATLGITDKTEARPQPPLFILQAQTQDEGVSSCDSDLFLPFFG